MKAYSEARGNALSAGETKELERRPCRLPRMSRPAIRTPEGCAPLAEPCATSSWGA